MRTIIVHKTNSFRLGTTKKYAVLAFKEDGLKIFCTNENPENFDTLVLALASRVGIIYLPTIVMQAYGLEREDYEVEIINENKFFIRRKRLFDISFEKPLAMEEIEPIKEPIKEIRVCEEHTSEKDQIKEMVQLIRGISEMCQNIKNNNEQLRGRVEKLEAALF